MGRFPWKVAPLLAEVKKVFLKATTATHSVEQHKEAVTKETDTEAKSKGMKKDKKGKDKKQRKEEKSKVKDKKHKKHRDREPAKEGEIVDTQTGEPMPRALPTTWPTNWTGGDDSPTEAPGEDGRQTGGNDAASPTTTLDANQVGGEPERTSATPTAGSSSSLGAQRPRTPSRSPRRVVLQPSSRWKAVQRVQLPLRASRDSRRQAQ